MGKRKKVPKDVETYVLVCCRRRCCICYGLYRDMGVKNGQIAHLDSNPANYATENLAFLCLEQHDQFDSQTSQGKGLSKDEVVYYRDELYEEVKKKEFWE